MAVILIPTGILACNHLNRRNTFRDRRYLSTVIRLVVLLGRTRDVGWLHPHISQVYVVLVEYSNLKKTMSHCTSSVLDEASS